MAEIHINCPRPNRRLRRVLRCPTCDCRRRMVVEVYDWYGADFTCCGCGERWQDGEVYEEQPDWRAAAWLLSRMAQTEHRTGQVEVASVRPARGGGLMDRDFCKHVIENAPRWQRWLSWFPPFLATYFVSFVLWMEFHKTLPKRWPGEDDE